MEPAAIYAASDQLKCKINWHRVTADTEWIYIGNGKEVDKTIVMQKIGDIFTDPLILIAINRQASFVTTTDKLPQLLTGILGFMNFIIWDKSFKHALEFSDIGVMRYGRI